MDWKHAFPLLFFAILAGAAMNLAAQTVSTAADTKGVSLTIYNQNFAVVREIRQLQLQQGVTSVRYEDVAEKIDPTSISFKSLTDPAGVAVREQSPGLG